MKVALCNIPQKTGTGTTIPPLGITRIYDVLKENGYSDVHFYNIDHNRPSEFEIIQYFKELNPDIIGISAIVSTSYKYVKWISFILKKHYHNIPLILGGVMCASAEVILKKTAIDLCVIGEGENIIVEMCNHWERFKNFDVNDNLKMIKGIVFRNPGNKMTPTFTGYAPSIPSKSIKQVNYELLGQDEGIHDKLFQNPLNGIWFENDSRTFEDHRKGKKLGYINTSEGCVARCTFCHRWKKGYKVLDVDSIIDHMKYLMETFNIGFFSFNDENFGSNRRHAIEFVTKVKGLDILWYVGGIRVKSVDVELLKKMKESGCTAVLFGIESGSDKILTIMEKNATVTDNLNALNAVHEAGLYTLLQLVVGMPGENRKTIKETCDFVRKAIHIFSEDFPLRIWVNYAGAFPGTPLYEYALQQNLIGGTIDEEEKYLIEISEQRKEFKITQKKAFLNLSAESMPEALIFSHRISTAALETYQKKSYHLALKAFKPPKKDYFRLRRANPVVLKMFQRLGKPMYFVWKVLFCYKREQEILSSIKLLFSSKKLDPIDLQSLRKTVKVSRETTDTNLQPLREGR